MRLAEREQSWPMPPHGGGATAPVEAGEAAARQTLRDQIARLDGELGDLVLSQWPAPGAAAAAGVARATSRRAASGATIAGLADLERTRDALAAGAAAVRQELDARGQRQEHARREREEMLLDPARHRLKRVTNADVGEPGCGGWHVRPRFGLLGMLAGWWRVVVSSGCPLPEALRRQHTTPPPSEGGGGVRRVAR